ncbi:hypothetical protein NLU13_2193 [Sarocladium strictum]|uniref:KAR9-domain-containing protein n=1 Tax=Sarocladium strictum TaxID=5046 RepID=A0AA39GTW8_SARSR|nr:hypothetical protein NLU13_2193 [Sarocladium strictum]
MTTSQSGALEVRSPHPGSSNSGLTRARSTNDLHPTDKQHEAQARSRGLSLHRGQAQAQELAQAQDAPANILTFTDVSSNLVHLPFASTSYLSSTASDSRTILRQSVAHSQSTPAALSSCPIVQSPPFASSTSTVQEQLPQLGQPQPTPAPPFESATATSTSFSTTQPQPQPPSAIRRTSPGLAARLKALGFGSSSKKSESTHQSASADRIGRLDEVQLRQLDEKHQAGSFTSIISRRGRPWKGAAAASEQSDTSRKQEQGPSIQTSTFENPLLPEIVTTEPLAMDTQKYRLPDHTNGNGTKSIPETRREHLERNPFTIAGDQEDSPPPPPPKETPPAPATPLAETPSTDFPGLGSYFTPAPNRPGSIYTLSRASFANQLAQLTSLQLPDAESLSSQVTAIPTAQVASKALINAAEQIRSWISKASEVIGGLDSEDDVEWAAAGGREGLAEVENAISRFEGLIHAYVGAIEELQGRKDIANVPKEDLTRAVSQMEIILDEWTKIRSTLNSVRSQVEIAMEWEELWNNVLGDIQGEMDELSRLVFEMEERRHKSVVAAAAGGDPVDIGDLETIVEVTPPQTTRVQAQSRFSLPAFPLSPSSPGTPTLSQDDSSLLALFARMQPLRASLDFLPMRLSVFETRAEKSFPTACEELEMRRAGLDGSYKKLEKDAESLRKELGEDRWVIVFRGAGRQALKMHESVERSLMKVKEAVDAGLHLTSQPTMMKKIESFEAKKTHYGPAIERILSIIDKGLKDRLTVNGEILRLYADMEHKWTTLKDQMRETDGILEEILVSSKSQQLRDSISSMLSNEVSTTGSGHETPGSSPPSSVIMSSLGFDPHTPVPKAAKTRSSSVNSSAANRRHSSLPAPTSVLAKKTTGTRLSTITGSSSTTPVQPSKTQRPGSTLANRPRWSSATNKSDLDTGHNFKPLSLTTPSPYARNSPSTQRSHSSLTPSPGGSRLPTLQSRLARAASESPRTPPAPLPEETPTRRSTSRLASFRERIAASPGPYAQQSLTKPKLSSQSSASSTATNRRASLQPPRPTLYVEESQPSRPASSLASSSRRSTMLPQPKERESGRESPLRLSRLGMRKTSGIGEATRPKWRP